MNSSVPAKDSKAPLLIFGKGAFQFYLLNYKNTQAT